MKKYLITRIDEPDFGCEGRPDGKPAMAAVFLEDEQGKEIVIAYEDAQLYMRHLDEGDFCYYSKDEGLVKI